MQEAEWRASLCFLLWSKAIVLYDCFTGADGDFFFLKQCKLRLTDSIILLLFWEKRTTEIQTFGSFFLKKDINFFPRKRCGEQVICLNQRKLLPLFVIAEDEFVIIKNLLNMFYIMFLTGMRIGEVGGLMWKDIDFENKCLHINRSLSCQYEYGEKILRLTAPKTHNSY